MTDSQGAGSGQWMVARAGEVLLFGALLAALSARHTPIDMAGEVEVGAAVSGITAASFALSVAARFWSRPRRAGLGALVASASAGLLWVVSALSVGQCVAVGLIFVWLVEPGWSLARAHRVLALASFIVLVFFQYGFALDAVTAVGAACAALGAACYLRLRPGPDLAPPRRPVFGWAHAAVAILTAACWLYDDGLHRGEEAELRVIARQLMMPRTWHLQRHRFVRVDFSDRWTGRRTLDVYEGGLFQIRGESAVCPFHEEHSLNEGHASLSAETISNCARVYQDRLEDADLGDRFVEAQFRAIPVACRAECRVRTCTSVLGVVRCSVPRAVAASATYYKVLSNVTDAVIEMVARGGGDLVGRRGDLNLLAGPRDVTLDVMGRGPDGWAHLCLSTLRPAPEQGRALRRWALTRGESTLTSRDFCWLDGKEDP